MATRVRACMGASMDLHHESRDRQRLQENRRLVAERGANGEAPATVSSSPEPRERKAREAEPTRPPKKHLHPGTLRRNPVFKCSH